MLRAILLILFGAIFGAHFVLYVLPYFIGMFWRRNQSCDICGRRAPHVVLLRCGLVHPELRKSFLCSPCDTWYRARNLEVPNPPWTAGEEE
jgi:hypothetical protein